MAKIVIIGWYGTETIGDRAILAGLLHLFAETYSSLEVSIGSLYPFLTQRSLHEDFDFYSTISLGRLNKISIFDSGNPSDLNREVDVSDLVAIGGGPLYDNLTEMYMLEYAMARAYKKNKKTAILGCGLGPLKIKKYLKIFLNIYKYSTIRIFRDDNIKDFTLDSSYLLSCDPAVFAAVFFDENRVSSLENINTIAINIREIISGVNGLSVDYWKKEFSRFIRCLLNNTSKDLMMIPMHTFYVGGDDRNTMNEIAMELHSERIHVQNIPLSLAQIMELYASAHSCIGMRFHSVLLQTLLNGNNYVLDYTDPEKGKTINLLKQLGLREEFSGRYVSLINNKHIDLKIEDKQVIVERTMIEKYRSQYINALHSLSVE